MQALSASHIAEFKAASESEHKDDQDQLDLDIMLNKKSDNEWINSPPEMYSIKISKFPTVADFPIEIQEKFNIKSLFNTGAQVSCISYDCYREFKLETKKDTNVRATASSADGSNIGPIGIATCSILLDTHDFEHKFIVCKHLLCSVSLELDIFSRI